MSYELGLPSGCKIHNVFQVNSLRRFVWNFSKTYHKL
jgi:hypothetical protein